MQHKITVPRMNLWNYWNNNGERWGDAAHFNMIDSWCVNNLPKNDWKSFFDPSNGTKEFVFTSEKLKTLFLLRWGKEIT